MKRTATKTTMVMMFLIMMRRRNVFSFGGGGGGKDKKGTVMSKRALKVYMRIIITNALMKHHARYKVPFYMLSVVF